MTNDSIELEIDIAAPIEQVWSVLIEPKFLGAWFGNGEPAHVELHPGGLILFDHGVHGQIPARVQAVDPPSVLSYRWSQGAAGEEPTDGNSTLVEIALVPVESGTRLRVTESGFAHLDLPASAVADRFSANSANWPGKLEELRDYVKRQRV